MADTVRVRFFPSKAELRGYIAGHIRGDDLCARYDIGLHDLGKLVLEHIAETADG